MPGPATQSLTTNESTMKILLPLLTSPGTYQSRYENPQSIPPRCKRSQLSGIKFIILLLLLAIGAGSTQAALLVHFKLDEGAIDPFTNMI